MTSGLAGDDSLVGGADGISDRMAQSRDWVRHIRGRRLETTPGERFAYSSAGSHLLSAMVADATGQSTLAFAQVKLEAYEQATVAWPRDPQGYHYGGGFLKLPARDLAKFG